MEGIDPMTAPRAAPETARDVAPLPLRDEAESATDAAPASLAVVGEPPRLARAARRPVKILFFAANAVPEKHLAIEEEHRAIEKSIAASKHRDAFVVITKLAAREGELQQALLQHQPDLVHFACHGNVEAELLLLGRERGAATVSPASLTAQMRALGKVALVVFNACWSREQAEAIRDTVGLAIGMREPIGDAEAIRFASAFYNALGHGRSVRNAFDWGLAAIQASSRRQIPQLFEAAGVKASEETFAGGPAVRRRSAAALAGLSGAVALAVAWRGWPADAPPPPGPGPRADMVRIAGGALVAGRITRGIDRAHLLAACRAAEATQECGASAGTSPGGSSGVSAGVFVPTFDLDRHEVSHRDFAAWLHTQATPWTLDPHGRVKTQQTPPLALALVAPACGGGLLITQEGQLRAAADKADWPVTCVTWHGASEYCRGQGKRLPLASEWQLAAQGSEGRLFPWGAELPRPDVVAFERGDGATKHPRPVGSSPQDVTPQGVRDLGGNVGEWVADDDGGSGGDGSSGGGGASALKTIRGGTWASIGPCHLLGSRCVHKPAESYAADVGFRCARSVLGDSIARKASP